MDAAQLGKEAARRTTSKSRTVKINTPGGAAAALRATKEDPKDGRQIPWSYGEKRKKK